MAPKAARQREAERRRRVTAMRVQQQRAERRRRVLTTGGLTVVMAAVVLGVIVLAVRGSGHSPGPHIAGVRSFSEKRDHVAGAVRYPQNPPAGGPHNPMLLNCGVYDQPVHPENAVHSLEHGAVWITYRADLPAAQVRTLKTTVGRQTYVILSPYPGLPAPVVASAWGKQLRLPSAGDPRLAAFLAAYRRGPQTPEPGAPCSGGTGTPTG